MSDDKPFGLHSFPSAAKVGRQMIEAGHRPKVTKRDAVISECKRYRYALSRSMEDGMLTTVLFIMLNPSVADAYRDDHTVRKCMGFAMCWGHRELLIGNVFPWRSSHPEDLWDRDNPIMDERGHDALIDLIDRADVIVPAWGRHVDHPRLKARVKVVRSVISMYQQDSDKTFVHLGLTKSNQPRHPLYIPYAKEPEPWQ